MVCQNFARLGISIKSALIAQSVEQLPLKASFRLVRSSKINASLAQSVEQLPFKEMVVGSSPTGGTSWLILE